MHRAPNANEQTIPNLLSGENILRPAMGCRIEESLGEHLKGQRISDLRLWGEPRFERAKADRVSRRAPAARLEHYRIRTGYGAHCELRRTGRTEDFADGRPRRTSVRYHSFAGSTAPASDGLEAGPQGPVLLG